MDTDTDSDADSDMIMEAPFRRSISMILNDSDDKRSLTSGPLKKSLSVRRSSPAHGPLCRFCTTTPVMHL